MRIAIEGNIGAGKSTCMAVLAKALHPQEIVFVHEPLDVWTALPDPQNPPHTVNLLDCYYQNIRKYAFPFQILAINSYAERYAKMISKCAANKQITITERSLAASFKTFCQVSLDHGNVGREEYAVLTHHMHTVMQQYADLLDYDMVVYLRCSPERCLERIKARQRKEECCTISIDYITALHNHYERWCNQERFEPLRVKKFVVIDNDQLTVTETGDDVLTAVRDNA